MVCNICSVEQLQPSAIDEPGGVTHTTVAELGTLAEPGAGADSALAAGCSHIDGPQPGTTHCTEYSKPAGATAAHAATFATESNTVDHSAVDVAATVYFADS